MTQPKKTVLAQQEDTTRRFVLCDCCKGKRDPAHLAERVNNRIVVKGKWRGKEHFVVIHGVSTQ